MLKKRQRSMVMRRKVSVASMPSVPRRVRLVSGDDKQARARPIFFVSADTVEMGAGGGATPYLRRDTFAGLWMAAAFLAACGICHKPLAGKDAYIYRGEFAFCTKECRELYIMKDKMVGKNAASHPSVMPRRTSRAAAGAGAAGQANPFSLY